MRSSLMVRQRVVAMSSEQDILFIYRSKSSVRSHMISSDLFSVVLLRPQVTAEGTCVPM